MSKKNIDALKAAGWTFVQTFVGVFALALMTWLADLVKWASDDGATVAFPDPSVLVKAAVAAVAGAAGGLVAAVQRLVQANTALPGQPPSY